MLLLSETQYAEMQTIMEYEISTIGFLLEKWARIISNVKEMHSSGTETIHLSN